MTFVFKHPSLTALELLWRWLAAIPLLYLAWRTLAPTVTAIPLDTTALQSMTFFEPVRSVAVLAGQLTTYRALLEKAGRWWVPLAVLVWSAAAGFGRVAVLRRADPSLRPHIAGMAVASLLRAIACLFLLYVWARACAGAVYLTVVSPGRHGGEPSLVLLTAIVVMATLLAFLGWSVSIWALDLLPLTSMTGLRLTSDCRKALRSKLWETNLVMGIVRVILLVLALTFSASPLPFQSSETQAYINVWWIGVAALYILGSDLFHVVRRVTYLRLLQSIASQTNADTPHAS